MPRLFNLAAGMGLPSAHWPIPDIYRRDVTQPRLAIYQHIALDEELQKKYQKHGPAMHLEPHGLHNRAWFSGIAGSI